MNIVVANSVGVDQNGYHLVHVPSRWSLGVKNHTNCGYYPWELAYTSSLLKRETDHRVRFLDGILYAWDFDTYFQHIEKEQPDWLIMESSSRTWKEDRRLAEAAKQAFGTKVIFTGQHPMARPEEVSAVADHVCLGEYEFTVLDIIQGKDARALPGVYPNERAGLIDVNRLPFPEDTDVSRMDYHEPNCIYRQVQMYASRGCPRRCNFCAAATLYYDELNWRPRDVDNIVQEIATLKDKYPEMEGVFFDEEVHNIRPGFNIALAQKIRAEGLDGLKYEAMCEYASLDEAAMREMKKAGYYKIRFGIETGSDEVARHMTLGKKHDLAKMRRMLEVGKDIGLMFYGTTSIGGLGSTEDEDKKTVDLIHELTRRGLLDEVQVSVNTPQPGTDFYNTALEKGWLRDIGDYDEFDGNGQVCVDYPHYPADRIQATFNAALEAYDRGKEEARADSLKKTLGSSLEKIGPGQRVVTLRSVRNWMVSILLGALHNRTGAPTDLLAQDVVQEMFQNHKAVGSFFSYGAGFFSPDRFPRELENALRQNEYDWVVVPMANRHLEGYTNALEVARSLGGKHLMGIFADGTCLELT